MARTETVVGKLPKFDKEVFERIVETLSREARDLAENAVRSNIRKTRSVASGEFLQSVTSEFKKSRASSYLVSVTSLNRAAEPLESGLPPTDVPIDAIYQWMKDKGINEDPQFAYYVQAKLAKEGYEGRHIFENAEEAILDKIDDLVNEILNREEFYK